MEIGMSAFVFLGLLGALQGGAPALSCEANVAERKQAEIETINAGMAIYRTVAEADWTAEQTAQLEAMSDLLDARDRPVDAQDVDILDAARGYLRSPETWDRADDRRCEAEDTSWSLFCALRRGSEDVLGHYEHRRTVLQEVRFIINARSVGRDYEHRLMDYNNDPVTRFEDVLSVLDEAQLIVGARLEAQCRTD
jgi:hypothetical protein